MVLKYSEDIYPKDVLIKAAFVFLDRAYIHIDKEESTFIVSIISKEDEKEVTEGEFDNEMLAQAARYVISKRTKNIREITLARAMASTLLEDTSDVEESVVDDVDVDSILKDWFADE